jgi:hypothetical protein
MFSRWGLLAAFFSEDERSAVHLNLDTFPLHCAGYVLLVINHLCCCILRRQNWPTLTLNDLGQVNANMAAKLAKFIISSLFTVWSLIRPVKINVSDYSSFNRNEGQKLGKGCLWEVERGRCVRLTSPQSGNGLSRQCGTINITEPYWSPWHVTFMVSLYMLLGQSIIRFYVQEISIFNCTTNPLRKLGALQSTKTAESSSSRTPEKPGGRN